MAKAFSSSGQFKWNTATPVDNATQTTPIPFEDTPVDTTGWEENEPLFKLEDIVYINHSPQSACTEWPCINTKHEIDCKIIEIKKDHWYLGGYSQAQKKRLHYFTYELISGNGARVGFVGEEFLIPARDKHLHQKEKFKTLIEDTELAPKDAVFVYKNDYYSNDKYGVYIHKDRMEELKSLFK